MLDQPRADRLRRQLRDLPELYVYATLALQPGSAPKSLNTSGGTKTPPLPCRLDLPSHLACGLRR